jgi:hypothetical protein
MRDNDFAKRFPKQECPQQWVFILGCHRKSKEDSPHGLQASAPANDAVTPLGMRLPPQEGD